MTSLFGDVFGVRGDYSKGFMYAARRSYLVPPAKAIRVGTLAKRRPCKEEVVKPPQLFETRRQARHIHLQRAKAVHVRALAMQSGPRAAQSHTALRRNRAEKIESEGGLAPPPYAHHRAPAYNNDNDSDSEDDRKDVQSRIDDAWAWTKQAGVFFWNNDITGEALSDKDFRARHPDSSKQSPPPKAPKQRATHAREREKPLVDNFAFFDAPENQYSGYVWRGGH